MSEEQSITSAEFLAKNQNVFSLPGELGCTDLVYHHINTGDAQPIKIPSRRMSPSDREEAQKQINEMLELGIIQPSKSAWCAPIVLVTKKDKTKRFCIDNRKLNSATVKDAYPLPRTDDTLDTLSGSKWFSCLDLTSSYWQIKVSQEDRPKTAFSIGSGLHEFRVMPFGLATAANTFERLAELVLSGLTWKSSLVYLDDIVVFSSSFQEQIERLQEIFNRLIEANLKLKPKKFTLMQKKILYLGHIISEDGIETDPNKTEVVKNWPTPKNIKELRSFLGMCSYYRRFVSNFSHIASPLHALTKQNSTFDWSSKCDEAFNCLKENLVNPPILALPDFSLPLILDTEWQRTCHSLWQSNIERC